MPAFSATYMLQLVVLVFALLVVLIISRLVVLAQRVFELESRPETDETNLKLLVKSQIDDTVREIRQQAAARHHHMAQLEHQRKLDLEKEKEKETAEKAAAAETKEPEKIELASTEGSLQAESSVVQATDVQEAEASAVEASTIQVVQANEELKPDVPALESVSAEDKEVVTEVTPESVPKRKRKQADKEKRTVVRVDTPEIEA
jgi:hypothetical protein